MPAGQAFPYDPAIAEMVWDRIAQNDVGLDEVLETLANEGVAVPSRRTWYEWLKANEEMAHNSARAREMQADYIAALAVKEAKTSRIGEKVRSDKDGTEITTGDNVERSKLIVQTLFKRAGQLAPKVYGERVQQEHSGELTVKRVVSDI
jgi:hypothetical protein